MCDQNDQERARQLVSGLRDTRMPAGSTGGVIPRCSIELKHVPEENRRGLG